MAYRFKFETLLTFRKNVEEQSRLRLTRELAALERYRGRLAELRTERLLLIDEFEASKKEKLEVLKYQYFIDAINYAEVAIINQVAGIALQEELISGVRRDLVEKMRARKVIEKVRERDKLVYLREMAKKEQKEGDEQVLLRFGKEAARL